MSEKLLTLAEAAERVGVSEKTLRREISAKRLTPTKIRGCVRIAPVDFENYLKICRSGSAVIPGGLTYHSGDEGLASLLAKARKRKKRANLKPDYEPTITPAESGVPHVIPFPKPSPAI